MRMSYSMKEIQMEENLNKMEQEEMIKKVIPKNLPKRMEQLELLYVERKIYIRNCATIVIDQDALNSVRVTAEECFMENAKILLMQDG